jgi:hypothetical protein
VRPKDLNYPSGGTRWSLTHSKAYPLTYSDRTKTISSARVLAEADENEAILHVDIREFDILLVIYKLLI